MKYTRKFIRYSTQLWAQYFLNNRKEKGKECTVFDICRKGMGILFHTNEEINVGTIIHLEIPDPKSLETISVRGELRWLREKEGEFIGGIELDRILSEVELSRLSYAYTGD